MKVNLHAINTTTGCRKTRAMFGLTGTGLRGGLIYSRSEKHESCLNGG
jgi:hypothetical protein